MKSVTVGVAGSEFVESLSVRPVGKDGVRLKISGTEELDALMPDLKKLDGKTSDYIWKHLPEYVRASVGSNLKEGSSSYHEYSTDANAKKTVLQAAKVVSEAVETGKAGASLTVVVRTPKAKAAGR